MSENGSGSEDESGSEEEEEENNESEEEKVNKKEEEVISYKVLPKHYNEKNMREPYIKYKVFKKLLRSMKDKKCIGEEAYSKEIEKLINSNNTFNIQSKHLKNAFKKCFSDKSDYDERDYDRWVQKLISQPKPKKHRSHKKKSRKEEKPGSLEDTEDVLAPWVGLGREETQSTIPAIMSFIDHIKNLYDEEQYNEMYDLITPPLYQTDNHLIHLFRVYALDIMIIEGNNTPLINNLLSRSHLLTYLFNILKTFDNHLFMNEVMELIITLLSDIKYPIPISPQSYTSYFPSLKGPLSKRDDA